MAIAAALGAAPPTVVAWVIPIPEEEAFWIKERGWKAYEELLERTSAAFFNLNRPPICGAE